MSCNTRSTRSIRNSVSFKSASDPTAQRQGMQRHWSMMQDHMRSVRKMPGMHAQGCRDWMMMDPQHDGSGDDGTRHDGQRHDGLPDDGARHGSGRHVGHAFEHGSRPVSVADAWKHDPNAQPDGRNRSREETRRSGRPCYASITKRCTAACSPCVAWGGCGLRTRPFPCPTASRKGPSSLRAICSQCHSHPSPALHTKSEWAGVTTRMRQHMQARTSADGAGVRIPSPAELDVLTEYLAKHAAGD